MKVTLKPDDKIVPFGELEEIPQQEVFGVIKKPEDPPIKSLLAWQEPESPTRPQPKTKWATEMRDSYKGFFMLKDQNKLFTTKQPLFDRSAVNNPQFKQEDLKGRELEEKKETSYFKPNPNFSQESIIEHQSEAPSQPFISQFETEQEAKETQKTPNQPQKNTKSAKSLSVKPQRPKTAQSKTKSAKNLQNQDESNSLRRKRQAERIKKLQQTSRWLPNSAFTTYFGKPAFANYGQGNTNPTWGGVGGYGSYMKTHNVNPHEGSNKPKFEQVYQTAEKKALTKKPRSPEPPRKCKDEDRLNPQMIEEIKRRALVLPLEKKNPSRPIAKPNLFNVKTFKSEHNTPEPSFEQKKSSKPWKQATPVPTKTKKPQEPKDAPKTIAKEAPKVVQEVPNQVPQEAPKQVVQEVPKEHPEPIIQELPKQPEPIKQPQVEESQMKPIHKDEAVQSEVACDECLFVKPSLRMSTTYKEMASAIPHPSAPKVSEPYKYCINCLKALYPEKPDLTPEDMVMPPNNLGEIPPEELNPRNYKTLPSKWTQRIPAAGKLSYKSPSAYSLIFWDDQYM